MIRQKKILVKRNHCRNKRRFWKPSENYFLDSMKNFEEVKDIRMRNKIEKQKLI